MKILTQKEKRFSLRKGDYGMCFYDLREKRTLKQKEVLDLLNEGIPNRDMRLHLQSLCIKLENGFHVVKNNSEVILNEINLIISDIKEKVKKNEGKN